jgi:hypothetical protein
MKKYRAIVTITQEWEVEADNETEARQLALDEIPQDQKEDTEIILDEINTEEIKDE